MSQTITKGVKTLLGEANGIVKKIPVAEAKAIIGNDDYVFIDLRDPAEVQTAGKLPGAVNCPRGVLEFCIDPASPFHKEVFNQNKTYVFYCASSGRSALSGKAAIEMGLTPVVHLEGGFNEWVKQDGPVEKE